MPVPDRTVTHISWRDLFPWLAIFRALPIAVSVTVVAFATLGVVATPMGWLVSERVFLSKEILAEDAAFREFVEFSRSPYRAIFDSDRGPTSYVDEFGKDLRGTRAVYERMVLPFRMMFWGDLGTRKFFYLLFGSLWMVTVWSFSGVAISRHALMRLTRDELLPIDETFWFGWQRWTVCLAAFGAIALVAILLLLPMGVVGLFLNQNWTSLIGALLWIVVVLCAVPLSLLLFGLIFCWPIIVTSVAAENQNSLDAVTRSYAYVYQRPLHLVFYGTLSLLFGALCWLIVFQVSTRAIELGFWGASWGHSAVSSAPMDAFLGTRSMHLDPARYSELTNPETSPEAVPATVVTASRIIRFFNSLISTLAVGFIHGLFWCMASAIYLLLRRDVDEVEMDEIFIEEDARSYDLPPLKSDEQGIPQIEPLDEYLQRQEKSQNRNADVDDLGE